MGCNTVIENKTNTNVSIAGAMSNVMRKGDLSNTIKLDTISNKKNLYGIGPNKALKGELLINDGVSYVSKVTSDSTMLVEKTFKTSAPFFVSANVEKWTKIELPSSIRNIEDLEKHIDKTTIDIEQPFAYKLIGQIESATIHIQNLPDKTIISSPKDAHKGQVNYKLNNESVEIVGFFSRKHQGIFTHHDSFLHMHLITENENFMGHLDTIKFEKMTLLLPKYQN